MKNTEHADTAIVPSCNLRELPLGVNEFVELRNDHSIYVDKTELIYELAVYNGYFLLARPRCFGKSLLVSTFESLFKYGLRDFKGLAIEKLWHDKTYPVIRINFALCKDFESHEQFRTQMIEVVSQAFKNAGFELPPLRNELLGVGSSVHELFYKLDEDIRPVLLIDEYDAPINACLNDPELYKKVCMELNSLYVVIKDISSRLRFFFYTGICSYNNMSIFSDTNYVTEISRRSEFATLLGFTDEEIRAYFTPYVENAARVLNISVDECFEKLKESYDGYCFDEREPTHVYNPWSVLSFFKSPEKGFGNYWYSSVSKSSLLLNCTVGNALRDVNKYGRDQFITEDDLNSIREVNDYALLYQTGYLTIKEAFSSYNFILNYPNTEIAISLAKLYAKELFKGNEPIDKIHMDAYKLFSTEQIEMLPEKLNEVISCINQNNFPIKDEASLETFFVVYACAHGIDAKPQLYNPRERTSLEFAAGNRYFVLVLKIFDDSEYKREQPKKIQNLLDATVAQIKEKHYGESNSQGKELIRIALVFSLKHKSFVGFKLA